MLRQYTYQRKELTPFTVNEPFFQSVPYIVQVHMLYYLHPLVKCATLYELVVAVDFPVVFRVRLCLGGLNWARILPRSVGTMLSRHVLIRSAVRDSQSGKSVRLLLSVPIVPIAIGLAPPAPSVS
jgi:hypothetical protein